MSSEPMPYFQHAPIRSLPRSDYYRRAEEAKPHNWCPPVEPRDKDKNRFLGWVENRLC